MRIKPRSWDTYRQIGANAQAHVQATFMHQHEYARCAPVVSPHPTYWEMRALWTAAYLANTAEYNGSCRVPVKDGTSNAAWVYRGEAQIIDSNDRVIKEWRGVPPWPRKETPMRRLPDHYVQGNQINVQVSGRRVIDARTHTDVYHGDVVHHHHMPIEHVQHGQAYSQNIVVQPAAITVEQRSFWGEVFFGSPKQQQALPPLQREMHRGNLTSAPSHGALPAPQPSRQAQAPLQIEHQRSMEPAPMSIAAAFKKVLR